MSEVSKLIYQLSPFVEDCLTKQNRAFSSFEYNYLQEVINQHQIQSVLDIGTGEGSFIAGLASLTPDVNYHAIDVGEDLISIAKEKNQQDNIVFTSCLFDSSFPEKKYDLILARFSVEHMKDIAAFIAEAYKRLKKGGILLVTEYYVENISLQSDTWNIFREKELEFYTAIGSNARTSIEMPKLMHKEAFKKINSNLRHISPSTIGFQPFYELIISYANIYGNIVPEVWTDEIKSIIIAYAENSMHETSSHVEDVLFISHTIGYA